MTIRCTGAADRVEFEFNVIRRDPRSDAAMQMKSVAIEEFLKELEAGGAFKDAFESFAAALSPEMMAEAHAKAKRKRTQSRFELYCEVLCSLVMESVPLVDGDTLDERYSAYLNLVVHPEGLWDDAVAMFDRERFATAFALAIVCLEEIGKIGAARFHVAMSAATLATIRARATEAKRRGDPFFDHRKKHLLAAGGGALINARLDRILGMDAVCEFLDDVDAGGIEVQRQSALYVDLVNGRPQLPDDAIDRHMSLRFVVLAGECLAEVLGFQVDEWDRFLAKVKSFEERNGIDPD